MYNKNYPNDYFSANKLVLKFGGMWVPNRSESFRKWLNFVTYNCFCIVFCQLLFSPSEILKISDTYSNLQRLMLHTGKMTTHLLANFKVFTFYWKRKQILKLLESLEDGEFRYEEMNHFRPGLRFQKAKALSARVTYGFFIAAFLVPTSNYVSAGRKLALHYTEEDFLSGNITCFELLPYYSWIPFSTLSKTACGLGMVYQSISVMIYAWQIAGHDTLFSSILIYVKAHLVVLGQAFETMRSRCLHKVKVSKDYESLHDQSFPMLEEQMNREMKKCSRHLQTVIGISATIESIFNLVTLGQVLITLFVLVSCLFMLSSVPIFSGTFAAQCVYLAAITFQLGMYCWFGNEITLMSKNLPHSLYQSDWLSASPEFKKNMIMNMTRMQRPIILTVGKFSPLTLTTFASIVRGSYSYFAVLKKTNST